MATAAEHSPVWHLKAAMGQITLPQDELDQIANRCFEINYCAHQ
jgi:hypothetical protein